MVYVKMVNEIKALEINATLVENDFRMKEMNAKKRITFQNKVNYREVHKEPKLVETAGTKLNVYSEMKTLFVVP